MRELEPRRHVPVVVELRGDDLVARVPIARRRARQCEIERRHVRAEDRLLRRAAEKIRGREPRLRDQRLGPAARLVRPADVSVRVAEVARDGVDDRVGNLGPAGPVEERDRLAQRREARANRFDVERDRGH